MAYDTRGAKNQLNISKASSEEEVFKLFVKMPEK
jgi:hypothetical protein